MACLLPTPIADNLAAAQSQAYPTERRLSEGNLTNKPVAVIGEQQPSQQLAAVEIEKSAEDNNIQQRQQTAGNQQRSAFIRSNGDVDEAELNGQQNDLQNSGNHCISRDHSTVCHRVKNFKKPYLIKKSIYSSKIATFPASKVQRQWPAAPVETR